MEVVNQWKHGVLRPHWADLQTAAARLKAMTLPCIKGITDQIPHEWQVDPRGRAALANLVYNRAVFLSENFIPELEKRA